MDNENITIGDSPKKSGGSMVVIGFITLVLIAGGFYFLKNNTNATPSATPAQVETAQVEGAAIASEPNSSQSITVEGGEFYYEPNEIRVKMGQKVVITFNNVKGFHDFVLDEFNVRTKQLAEGKSETVEFTPDKIGTFEYYCSVGKHRQNGMVGNLIVEP